MGVFKYLLSNTNKYRCFVNTEIKLYDSINVVFNCGGLSESMLYLLTCPLRPKACIIVTSALSPTTPVKCFRLKRLPPFRGDATLSWGWRFSIQNKPKNLETSKKWHRIFFRQINSFWIIHNRKITFNSLKKNLFSIIV